MEWPFLSTTLDGAEVYNNFGTAAAIGEPPQYLPLSASLPQRWNLQPWVQSGLTTLYT